MKQKPPCGKKTPFCVRPCPRSRPAAGRALPPPGGKAAVLSLLSTPCGAPFLYYPLFLPPPQAQNDVRPNAPRTNAKTPLPDGSGEKKGAPAAFASKAAGDTIVPRRGTRHAAVSASLVFLFFCKNRSVLFYHTASSRPRQGFAGGGSFPAARRFGARRARQTAAGRVARRRGLGYTVGGCFGRRTLRLGTRRSPRPAAPSAERTGSPPERRLLTGKKAARNTCFAAAFFLLRRYVEFIVVLSVKLRYACGRNARPRVRRERKRGNGHEDPHAGSQTLLRRY